MSPAQAHEAELPSRMLVDAPSAAIERFRDLIRTAGIRMRRDQGRWFVRLDPSAGDFLILKPLQNADGDLRADAGQTLYEYRETLLTAEQAARVAEQLEERHERMTITAFSAVQHDLYVNTDSLAVLRELLRQVPGLWLYRVRPTKRFWYQDIFWRLVSILQEEGISLRELREQGRWPSIDAVSGLELTMPAYLVCAPLVSRNQPLVAVLTTVWGAQVAVVPEGVYTRPLQGAGWPVGLPTMQLLGAPEDLYTTRFEHTSRTLARELLEEFAAGVNRLAVHISNPGGWTSGEERLIDSLERNIAWSSVRFGLGALSSVGESWSSEESVWAAFRSLGALQGIWEGGAPRSIQLRELLDPERIRGHALQLIPEGFLRDWYSDILGTYENQLDRMYPGLARPEALRRLQELRNLIHGTGAPTGMRANRLAALRGLGDIGLGLVRDVAAIWWVSVLASPSTHCVPGRAPWA